MLTLIYGIVQPVKQGRQSLDMFLTIILSLLTVTSIVDARCDSFDKEICFKRFPGGTKEECKKQSWILPFIQTKQCEIKSGKYQWQ